MIIRPVLRSDSAAILSLAKAAGIGMTSLPPDRKVLADKVERAASSFDGTINDPNDALFFFVMEDPTNGEIVGTCGVEAHIGLKRPVYSYKRTSITQYSDSLDIFSRNDMLYMVNEYTGVSELTSLFLLPEYRRDRLGRFLSRVRFLFIAMHRARFDDRIIAEIRGWHDGNGNAPFYDSLARKFFQMDFSEADWICATKGNRFISELMPTHPIYISLLPAEARDVIGKAYTNSEPAKAMLEREGFTYSNYVDIFDGGPTLDAQTSAIRTVTQTLSANVTCIDDEADANHRTMVATDGFKDFRACMGFARPHENGVAIHQDTAKLLSLSVGDMIHYAPAVI